MTKRSVNAGREAANAAGVGGDFGRGVGTNDAGTSTGQVEQAIVWIRANPVEATALALGLGFAVAVLLTPGRPHGDYAKVESRLKKTLEDLAHAKDDADAEIASLKAELKDAKKEAKEARRHYKKDKSKLKDQFEEDLKDREDEIEEQLTHEHEHEDSGGGSSRSLRALILSALGAQAVQLVGRWVSRRALSDWENADADIDESQVGFDQEPRTSEYTYTPPI